MAEGDHPFGVCNLYCVYPVDYINTVCIQNIQNSCSYSACKLHTLQSHSWVGCLQLQPTVLCDNFCLILRGGVIIFMAVHFLIVSVPLTWWKTICDCLFDEACHCCNQCSRGKIHLLDNGVDSLWSSCSNNLTRQIASHRNMSNGIMGYQRIVIFRPSFVHPLLSFINTHL